MESNPRFTIDVTTEVTMRKVLFAVIKKDENEFEVQLEALAEREALLAGCARATDLVATMLVEQRQGRPRPDTIRELAISTADFSRWSEIAMPEFQAYLTSIFDGASMEKVLTMGSLLRIPFIQCAFLLLLGKEADEQWHEYLDRLWEVVETRNNPSRVSGSNLGDRDE